VNSCRTPPAPARDRRALLAAAVLLVIPVAPFLGAAFKIDDPLYLELARHVAGRPLDPLGAATFWHERPARAFDDMYNPPLIAYVLWPAIALGGTEAAVHVLMLVLGVGAVLTLAEVARALGVPASLAPVVAASPVLAVCTLSAMTEVPFVLLSALCWQQAARGRPLAAGALAGVSALCKYAGVYNLLLFPLLTEGRPRRRTTAGVALGVAILASFGAWTASTHGEPHWTAASRPLGWSAARLWEAANSAVAALAIVTVPAVLGLLRVRTTQWTAGLGAGAVAAWSVGRELGPGPGAVAFVAFGSGVVVLLAAARATRTCWRECPFPAAAFWLFTAHAALFVYFGTARYLAPVLGPLVWLLARGGELREDASLRRRGASLGFAAALTLLLAWADSGAAEAWRKAAGSFPPGAGRAWHTGKWGFDSYARQNGSTPLAPRAELRAGDQVAEPVEVHTAGPWPAQSARLGGPRVVRIPSPAVRLMDRGVGAGFYSSAWGRLPFGFRLGAFEEVRLRSVPAWIDSLLAGGAEGPVGIDLGSELARHTLLDGWSAEESFDDGGVRRTFVWAVGRESALRVPLPGTAASVALRASPAARAVGLLEVEVGPDVRAEIDLRPGWRTYEVPLSGPVPRGPTTLVLRPAGHHVPSRFARERRELSVAVDWIGFGSMDGLNRGAWPASFGPDVPGVAVSRSRLRWAPATATLEGRVRALDGRAALSVGEDERVLAGPARGDVPFTVEVGPRAPVALTADEAILTLGAR
jgi:hypothetical protein